MLNVTSLQCIRGDRSLFQDLSFELSAGELMHLVGHNGSGKTTLLRTLAALAEPAAGTVAWDGKSIDDLQEEYTGNVLYIGHKNAIKDDLTAIENLQIACVLDGSPVAEDHVWQALAKIGLKGFEDLPTRVLSQGQKRRVSLARLLLSKTRLWILDEPFVALDKAAVSLLQQVLREHIEAGGMAIITTHQDVELITDQVKCLELGWKKQGRV